MPDGVCTGRRDRCAQEGWVPGHDLSDGAYDLTFELYDTADPSETTPLWRKTIENVQVVEGRFVVVLEGVSEQDGTEPPEIGEAIAEAQDVEELYLEISEGGTTLGPRRRLASAPYAVVAEQFAGPGDAEADPAWSVLPRVATLRHAGPLTPGISVPSDPDTTLNGFLLEPTSLLRITFQMDAGLSVAVHISVTVDGEPWPLPSVSSTLIQPGKHAFCQWLVGPTGGELPADVDVAIARLYGEGDSNSILTLEEIPMLPDELDEFRAVPPEADFTADIVRGSWPLTVRFKDLSDPGSMPILSWSWDFGDDLVPDPVRGEPTSISVEQNPEHLYSRTETLPRSYDVRLTVVTEDGEDTIVKEDFITVEALKR